MLAALLRISKKNRSKIAKIWGKRGNISQEKTRKTRNLDEETIRLRSLYDRRGDVIRAGISYSSDHLSGEPWKITYSINGTTKQIDIVKNNEIITTCGLRNVLRGMKRQKL